MNEASVLANVDGVVDAVVNVRRPVGITRLVVVNGEDTSGTC